MSNDSYYLFLIGFFPSRPRVIRILMSRRIFSVILTTNHHHKSQSCSYLLHLLSSERDRSGIVWMVSLPVSRHHDIVLVIIPPYVSL